MCKKKCKKTVHCFKKCDIFRELSNYSLPYFLSINFQSIQIFATLGHPQVAMKLANSFRDKQRISGQQDLRQKDIQPCDSWEKLEMD